NSRESGRLESTRKDLTMLDFDVLNTAIQKHDDNLIATIKKRRCGLAVLEGYVEKGLGQWSEVQVTQIINDHYCADAVKKMTEQSGEGVVIRKALQKASYAQHETYLNSWKVQA